MIFIDLELQRGSKIAKAFEHFFELRENLLKINPFEGLTACHINVCCGRALKLSRDTET